MEGQWNCTSNPNDTNEYCVVSTQNWYVYTLLKGVFLFRAMNFCVGEYAVGIKAVDSCGGESMSFESGAVDFPPGES